MARRVILVYNKSSSHFADVDQNVIRPLRGLVERGHLVECTIKRSGFEHNVKELKKAIKKSDLVIAAGGDGTATITANAIIASKRKDISFGVLGYGNFNDMSHSFGTRRAEVEYLLDHADNTSDVYPLHMQINGKHFRYGVGYFTIGLFAEATEVFDHKEKREKMQNGHANPLYSWKILVDFYLKSRKTIRIPDYTLNDGKVVVGTTDYIALNGRWMAQVLKGERNLLGARQFISAQYNLSQFHSLAPFMLRSILHRAPGYLSESDTLAFSEPASVEIQAEGEYCKMSGIKTIKISKTEQPLHVIAKK